MRHQQDFPTLATVTDRRSQQPRLARRSPRTFAAPRARLCNWL